ncbi:hypothetical protein SAMN04488548_1344267 [Gordonia westfalica]|uniref:Uncharacterized protein n=1 Tax=Gordonia westfalica TaxID=158898 RepID=A0A1H2L2E6_9ACTN|nr:hypothetical protein SAMN04488548_1344267 [Gordonia westfalica]
MEPMTGIEPAYSAWEAVFRGMLMVGLLSRLSEYLQVTEVFTSLSRQRIDWGKRKYKRK